MTDVQHIDCTTEEYHARDEWSNSQVKLIPKKVREFYQRHVTKEWIYKPTASQKLGTAVHRILLDGTEVLEIPDEVLSTSGSRAGRAWKEFEAEHTDQVLVKRGDAESEAIRSMVESVRAEPMAAKLLEAPGWTEHTLVYTDEETGLPLRVRPDKICEFPDGLVLFDLKTTENPLDGWDNFGFQAGKFGYHRQDAWYWDAVDRWKGEGAVAYFVFGAVRNKPPYECVTQELPERAVDLGRRDNRRALDELKRRLDSGDWNLPSFGHVPLTDLPERYYHEEKRNYG
jgi:hypothetical protein